MEVASDSHSRKARETGRAAARRPSPSSFQGPRQPAAKGIGAGCCAHVHVASLASASACEALWAPTPTWQGRKSVCGGQVAREGMCDGSAVVGHGPSCWCRVADVVGGPSRGGPPALCSVDRPGAVTVGRRQPARCHSIGPGSGGERVAGSRESEGRGGPFGPPRPCLWCWSAAWLPPARCSVLGELAPRYAVTSRTRSSKAVTKRLMPRPCAGWRASTPLRDRER